MNSSAAMIENEAEWKAKALALTQLLEDEEDFELECLAKQDQYPAEYDVDNTRYVAQCIRDTEETTSINDEKIEMNHAMNQAIYNNSSGDEEEDSDRSSQEGYSTEKTPLWPGSISVHPYSATSPEVCLWAECFEEESYQLFHNTFRDPDPERDGLRRGLLTFAAYQRVYEFDNQELHYRLPPGAKGFKIQSEPYNRSQTGVGRKWNYLQKNYKERKELSRNWEFPSPLRETQTVDGPPEFATVNTVPGESGVWIWDQQQELYMFGRSRAKHSVFPTLLYEQVEIDPAPQTSNYSTNLDTIAEEEEETFSEEDEEEDEEEEWEEEEQEEFDFISLSTTELDIESIAESEASTEIIELVAVENATAQQNKIGPNREMPLPNHPLADEDRPYTQKKNPIILIHHISEILDDIVDGTSNVLTQYIPLPNDTDSQLLEEQMPLQNIRAAAKSVWNRMTVGRGIPILY